MQPREHSPSQFSGLSSVRRSNIVFSPSELVSHSYSNSATRFKVLFVAAVPKRRVTLQHCDSLRTSPFLCHPTSFARRARSAAVHPRAGRLPTFLYMKRIDHLIASILPCSTPHPLYRGDPTTESILALLHQFSSKLVMSFSAQTFLTHAILVNGLWCNICALGIDDKKLWCALDVARGVLITALAIDSNPQCHDFRAITTIRVLTGTLKA